MTRLLRRLLPPPSIRSARLAAASRRGALFLTLGLPALLAGIALAAPGDLDLGFDGDGKTTIDYGGFDGASAVLVQPDGKIVVAGHGFPGGDFAVLRLNPDGSPDRGFGTAGSLAVDFGGYDEARAVALQADGKLMVAGSTSSPTPAPTSRSSA